MCLWYTLFVVGEQNFGMVGHKISFDIIGTNLANNQGGEFAGGD